MFSHSGCKIQALGVTFKDVFIHVLFLFMCMNVCLMCLCMHICMPIYTWHVYAGTLGGQKRAPKPLELQSQLVVGGHQHAENQSEVP